MATRRSGPKARRGRDHKAPTGEPVYGVPVPEALHEAIEHERSNLSRAEAVLGCLAISMESQPDPVNGPYYPEVAQLARELVRQSINGLDSLALQKQLLKDKVKESPVFLCVERAYPVLDVVESVLAGASDALTPAFEVRSERPFRLNEELRLSSPVAISPLDQRRPAASEQARDRRD